jgi:hypothetical protein
VGNLDNKKPRAVRPGADGKSLGVRLITRSRDASTPGPAADNNHADNHGGDVDVADVHRVDVQERSAENADESKGAKQSGGRELKIRGILMICKMFINKMKGILVTY